MNGVDRVAGGVPNRDGPPSERNPLRFVTAEELKRFCELDAVPLAWKSLTTWGLILGSLWLWSATGSAAVLAMAFVVVSACQHALFLLAHEGAHYSVARRKWLNDLVSDVLFAAPIFLTTEKYREGHLPHHTHLGDHRHDLEWRTWVLLRGRHFARLLAETLSGWKALVAIARLTPDKVGARRAPLRYVALVLLANGGLFAWCSWCGAPSAYFLLWLLPFFTLTQILLIVRAVAEHQPMSYAHRENPDQGVDLEPVLTRTFAAGPLERFLFAPVGAHHHEHHLLPGVPFAQLPLLHATLLRRGYFEAQPECVQTSFCSLLARLILASPEAPRAVPAAARPAE